MLLDIDISECEVAVILACPDSTAESALRSPLPVVGGVNAAWLTVVETVREALLQCHVIASQIEKTTVAFFAPLDENGLIRKDVRSAVWSGFDLSRALREHLQIGNARAEKRATFAEQKFGALRECDDWLYIYLGQRVEAAACVTGVLLNGHNRAALELGEICIERDGALGDSGRRGVLDAYCGEEAFMARARGYALAFQTARGIWNSTAVNSMAKSLCDDYVERLSQGVGTACAVLNPARVVLGGELFFATENKILEPLEARFKSYCLPVHSGSTPILAGQLGNDAAVLGAVAMLN